MQGHISLLILSHVADCCPECLSCLVELYADTYRPDFKGESVIYSREFIEETRFRRWSRFLNDIRELAFHGLVDYKKIGKDCIEVSLLTIQETPLEK